jgi:cold shock CspA family protein
VEVLGTVHSFDEARGIGLIDSDDGETFSFHCVDIDDGTRTISSGTRVRAVRSVGRLGHDEMTRIAKI